MPLKWTGGTSVSGFIKAVFIELLNFNLITQAVDETEDTGLITDGSISETVDAGSL